MSASKSFPWQIPMLVVLCSALAFGNCQFNNVPPPVETINFGPAEGISYRTDQNVAAGPQDPSDWTLDANWNAAEQGVFASLGTRINVNSTPQGTASDIGAYPNPATKTTTFHYATPGTVSCQIAVVNSTYQVVYSQNISAPASGLVLPLDLSAFPKGQRYRLYYLLYDGALLYYKGHGDIKVAE